MKDTVPVYATHQVQLAGMTTINPVHTMSTATSLPSSNPTYAATLLNGQDVQPVNAGLNIPTKADVAPVYDPASLVLLGISLLGLAGIGRRKLDTKRAR